MAHRRSLHASRADSRLSPFRASFYHSRPWPRRETWHVWSGFWATSLGTLASRVLGLVRDMATAALLGLGEGGVMDALVVAFRIPNLLRRIFGEGALAASFLPVFTAEHQRDPRRAWQLVSVLFALAGRRADGAGAGGRGGLRGLVVVRRRRAAATRTGRV